MLLVCGSFVACCVWLVAGWDLHCCLRLCWVLCGVFLGWFYCVCCDLICVCSWLDGFIVVAILGCWFVAVYSVCVEFCWGVSLLVVELLIVLLCRLLSPLL